MMKSVGLLEKNVRKLLRKFCKSLDPLVCVDYCCARREYQQTNKKTKKQKKKKNNKKQTKTNNNKIK